MKILDVDVIDGLCMTIITMSTVGYTEGAPMNGPHGAQPRDKDIVIGEKTQIGALRKLARDIRDVCGTPP